MNKKMNRLLEPNTRLYFVFLVIFAVAAYFFYPMLAYIEGGLVIFLAIYSLIVNRRRKRQLQEYIESVT